MRTAVGAREGIGCVRPEHRSRPARTCTDDIEPPKDSHARCGTSEPDSTSGPDVELDAEYRRGDAPVRRTGDRRGARRREGSCGPASAGAHPRPHQGQGRGPALDRKSTRLNSSHVAISYAVFCLKKKNTA